MFNSSSIVALAGNGYKYKQLLTKTWIEKQNLIINQQHLFGSNEIIAYICCYKIVKIMDKKEVKYFVGEFDRINEGLENRGLNADNVINIIHLELSNSPCDIGKKQQVIVYYKE